MELFHIVWQLFFMPVKSDGWQHVEHLNGTGFMKYWREGATVILCKKIIRNCDEVRRDLSKSTPNPRHCLYRLMKQYLI